MKARDVLGHEPRRVLFISDLHAPFQHPDALDFNKKIRDMFKTDAVCFLGDEADSHAISNYTKDPDGMTAGQEFDATVEVLKGFYKEFPTALICESNHTYRAPRMMKELGFPKRMRPEIRKMLEAPDSWHWAQHWYFGANRELVAEHGDAAKGGKFPYVSLMTENMMSTISGHHHGRCGLVWHRTPHKLMYGMGLGCQIHEESYAFAYGRSCKVKPIIAGGCVIDGEPVLLKMMLNSRGRWEKKMGIEVIEGRNRVV
jgi:hypothetical protein